MDKDGAVLYVGKAKKLRHRVHSYTQIGRLTSRLQQLVSTATALKFQILESELEALLVEAELIRTHQPKFNILLKDDKTPLYIHITDENFPRVLTLRKKEVVKKNPSGVVLGPFPSAFKTKEVLKIVRKIFKWCQNPSGGRACFYRHLDLCSGACTGDISQADYQTHLKNLALFLRGQKKQVVTNLEKAMLLAAKNEEFEAAQVYKEQIELIKEVTARRLAPDLILPQLQLTKNLEGAVQLRKILQDYLGLPKAWSLDRIEGYDVSNIQGTNPAVSMVTFTAAQPDTDEYRVFNIRSLNTPNDFAMLAEALTRRQTHLEWGKPDLVMIDGGRGQVRAVLATWQWGLPVIGLEKNPDRLVLPVKIDRSARLKIEWKILKLPSNHPALNLLQQIRDEAHRFAQKQHKSLRTKQMFN